MKRNYPLFSLPFAATLSLVSQRWGVPPEKERRERRSRVARPACFRSSSAKRCRDQNVYSQGEGKTRIEEQEAYK